MTGRERKIQALSLLKSEPAETGKTLRTARSLGFAPLERLLQKKAGMTGQCLVVSGLACALFCSQQAIGDNWSGSIRSKVQTDNRYRQNGDYTGEVWGQFAYVNPKYDFNARISTIHRVSTDIFRNRQDVYQAFLEKKLSDLPVTIRGGRFERSDSLGFYLLDGASANIALALENSPVTLDVYAGRPTRIDHVQSLDGTFVGGIESLFKFSPHLSVANHHAQLDHFDLRFGVQVMQRDEDREVELAPPADQEIVGDQFDAIEGETVVNTVRQSVRTYRLSSTAHIDGHLLSQDKPFELFLQGSYAADKNRLENVLVEGWWDPIKRLRLRNYYEAYRPRQPFVTFRDRFYSAYALGEQQVWRGSAQYSQNDKLRYTAGLQFASRDSGYNGEGFNAGISYQWRPAIQVRGEFDHLSLDTGERADSLYFSLSHALDAKTRYGVNLAWRLEDKLLYGQNQARGVENEWQYMIDHSLILGFSGSYINNSSLASEYLAAMQLTYYFDRFQPKAP